MIKIVEPVHFTLSGELSLPLNAQILHSNRPFRILWTMNTSYKPLYENSWALVIGINSYQHASPLTYACNDADSVAALLVSHLGFTSDRVILLKDQDATRDKIRETYLSFREKAKNSDDRLIVFFAGHGFTVDGRRGPVGYLVPVDGDCDNLNSLIRWDDLTRDADLIPAKHILFIIDACYSGLMMKRTATPGVKRFVSDMLQRLARQVITAGKANEVVADGGGPQGENSIFTGYLIEGLSGAAADKNGVLTASAIMNYVYQNVGQDNRSEQTPHYGHLDGDGDFILQTPNQDHINLEDKRDFEVEAFIEKPELISLSEGNVAYSSLNANSALKLSDNEFELYIEHLLSTNNSGQYNILIEKLRDKLINVWEIEQGTFRMTPQMILGIKEAKFLPAMHRLTYLGLLLLRYSAPLEWFNEIANLLEAVFKLSNYLASLVVYDGWHPKDNSLGAHASHTVPALESLMSAYLLGGYALSKKENTKYLSSFFPRVVKQATGPFDDSAKTFFLFWPISAQDGTPNTSRDVLIANRYGNSEVIKSIGGKNEWIKSAILQLDFLIDYHSFLSMFGEHELERVFKSHYSDVDSSFHPNYIYNRFNYIMPVVEKLWSTIKSGQDENYWFFEPKLTLEYEKIEPERRKSLLVRFFAYAQKEQARWFAGQNRGTYHVDWPDEIQPLVQQARNIMDSL